MSQTAGLVTVSGGESKKPRVAILYATDAGFVLPTVASALQMKRLCPPSLADIRIVTTYIPDDLFLTLRDHLSTAGIFVDSMPVSMFQDFERDLYNKTHVPPSALARFFLLDCVPDHYDRILYLDGDTWPTENPASLLTATLPPGMFAAAEDQSYYYQNEIGHTGRWVRKYFAGIGINGEDGYFNSGVILADAATWRQLSRDAFQFFKSRTALCLYHDQSALNAVAAGRRLRLAPKWNFLNAYYEWGLRLADPPCIIHFAGGNKPWEYPEHQFAKTYETAFNSLATLPFRLEPLSLERRQSMQRHQSKLRLKMATVFRYRRYRRQRLFDALCLDAAVS